MELYNCLDCLFFIEDVVAVGNMQTGPFKRSTAIDDYYFTVVLKWGPLDVCRNSARYENSVKTARDQLIKDWKASMAGKQEVAEDHLD